MAKYIVTSDTHLHAPSGSPVDAAGRNLMLTYIVECLDALLQSAIEHNATIWHCGDFFHDRKAIKPEVLHYAGAWLQRVCAAGIELHVLVGNHDLSLSGDGTSSANILQTYARVHDTPRVGVRSGPAGHICVLPYAVDGEKVRKFTESCPKGSILLAHLGIGDPRYADCVPTDYEVPGTISVSDLHPERFRQVFLGHYHKPQTLEPNVRYVGSPQQISFKETGQDKHWLLYDDATNTVTEIPNTISPRFHKLPASAAVQLDLHRIVGKRDHLWLTDATPDVEESARVSLAGHTSAVVRVDKARAAVKDLSRADIDTSTNAALCESYARTVEPNIDADKLRRVTTLGVKLLAGE